MARSITIHGLDHSVAKLVEERAKAKGWSLNKTIKALLEEALESKGVETAKSRGDFAEFLGVWKKSEHQEFERASADLRRIDDKDWH